MNLSKNESLEERISQRTNLLKNESLEERISRRKNLLKKESLKERISQRTNLLKNAPSKNISPHHSMEAEVAEPWMNSTYFKFPFSGLQELTSAWVLDSLQFAFSLAFMRYPDGLTFVEFL